jgi:hypothetical protein
VGIGWLRRVLAFLATRHETSGFEKIQAATKIKTTKSAMFQVGRGRLVRLVGVGQVECISLISFIFSISFKVSNPQITAFHLPQTHKPHLSRHHLLQTHKSLPWQRDKPTNYHKPIVVNHCHKPKPIRAKERTKERVEEREKKTI